MKKDAESCSLCGVCRAGCPIYLADLKETSSPRAKAAMIKNKSLRQESYRCTLCGACKRSCPLEIDLGIRGKRKELAEKGKETPKNKKMIRNIREYGNPFGKKGDDDNDGKELYCC